MRLVARAWASVAVGENANMTALSVCVSMMRRIRSSFPVDTEAAVSLRRNWLVLVTSRGKSSGVVGAFPSGVTPRIPC